MAADLTKVENEEAATVEEVELTKSQKTVTVRPQNTKDFWTLLRIIQKGGKDALGRLKDAENETQSIMVILDVGMEFAERELKGFMADLAGMTVEEYEQGDFDLTLSIIEKWEEQEDLAGFFRRAASFIKKFSGKK